MKRALLLIVFVVSVTLQAEGSWHATYRLTNTDAVPGSVVRTLTWTSGATERRDGTTYQWFALEAVKESGSRFRVWLLSRGAPAKSLVEARAATARYVVQLENSAPLEFRDRANGRAVLPSVGGWDSLLPRPAVAPAESPSKSVTYLGHEYLLVEAVSGRATARPPEAKVLLLRTSALIGAASNRKQKDPTRRYDRSEYEMVRLTSGDYRIMADAGMNCFRVDAEQARWVEDWNVYHWGVGGPDVAYPDCLYRSNYLGPALYFDEPGVVTRDRVVRPRLADDPEARRNVTPQKVVEDFRRHFHHELTAGPPARFLRGLAARADVDLGSMSFPQRNLYTWETLVSTAPLQLSTGADSPPQAIVFEPPGRVGTRRVVPEWNMAYGCQIPTDSPKNFIDVIYGFLRGAARVSGKDWGMSVYGAVDRTDAFWFQTHAYDLGARYFFYWDNYQLATVPYPEYLALSRNLSAHIESRPGRDVSRLRRAGEIAILLPTGYNLGHVYLGKGALWGIPELNLERRNGEGVKYRLVMRNFFTEIERAIRLGVAYDLLWDLPDLPLDGYREIVRVREDGKVTIESGGERHVFDGAREPLRPDGSPPSLSVELSVADGPAPLALTGRARVVERSAPVYYTLGADTQGIYRNLRVAWELYGPAEEDYRFLREEGWKARVTEDDTTARVEIDFEIRRPGEYRLRVATVDLAGRTAVVWKTIQVTPPNREKE